MLEDFVKHCRNDVAYAGLKSVVTKEKTDYMHSFLLAETFKYFYLLFAPEKTLDFKKVVFQYRGSSDQKDVEVVSNSC